MTHSNDTTKARLLALIFEQYYLNDPNQALEYARQSLELSKKIGYPRGAASALNRIGAVYYRLGDYKKAIDYYQQAVSLYRQINYMAGVATSYNNMAEIYRQQGNISLALETFFQSLRISEKIPAEKKNMCATVYNIGLLYTTKQEEERAMEYYQRALNIAKEIRSEVQMAKAIEAIGSVYFRKKNYEQALSCFKQTLAIYQKLGETFLIAYNLSNIADVYTDQKKYDTALSYFFQSLKIREEIQDKIGIAHTCFEVSYLYLQTKQYHEAINYAKKGLKAAQEINNKTIAYSLYENLHIAHAALGNYQQAYKYHQLFQTTKDSIFNAESDQREKTLQAQYDAEKRKFQINILEKGKVLQQLELQEQRYLLYGLSLAVVFFVALAVLLVYNNRQKNHINRLLTHQNEQISTQKEEISRQAQFLLQANDEIRLKNQVLEKQHQLIEQKNQDIEGSLHYARRIQDVLLPKSQRIQQTLAKHFVLLKPKEIVSGDFYWFSDLHAPAKVIIGCVDCAGHGVPGAFMSLIADALLSQIVNDRGITQPQLILQELHKAIRKTLHQDSGEHRDGMNMALCCIDFENRQLHYAGANLPMLLIQEKNGESLLQEIKPDKRPIGGWQRDDERIFTLHSFELQSTTCFYLFSDGYQNQFDKDKREKFSFKQLRELIFDIHTQDMDQQKQILIQTLNNWQGETEQVDDIMLIAVKI